MMKKTKVYRTHKSFKLMEILKAIKKQKTKIAFRKMALKQMKIKRQRIRMSNKLEILIRMKSRQIKMRSLRTQITQSRHLKKFKKILVLTPRKNSLN